MSSLQCARTDPRLAATCAFWYLQLFSKRIEGDKLLDWAIVAFLEVAHSTMKEPLDTRVFKVKVRGDICHGPSRVKSQVSTLRLILTLTLSLTLSLTCLSEAVYLQEPVVLSPSYSALQCPPVNIKKTGKLFVWAKRLLCVLSITSTPSHLVSKSFHLQALLGPPSFPHFLNCSLLHSLQLRLQVSPFHSL